eukprot:146181_1
MEMFYPDYCYHPEDSEYDDFGHIDDISICLRMFESMANFISRVKDANAINRFVRMLSPDYGFNFLVKGFNIFRNHFSEEGFNCIMFRVENASMEAKDSNVLQVFKEFFDEVYEYGFMMFVNWIDGT